MAPDETPALSAATRAVEDMARGYAVGREERRMLPAATCLAMADAADVLLRRFDDGDVHAIPHGDADFLRGKVEGLREKPKTGGRGTGEYRTRSNPHLMLVTGNPPRSDILDAWCRFHQRDEFEGDWKSVPDIRGVPKAMFILGRCAELDVGGGPQELLGGTVYLCCNPADDSLWMISRASMNLAGAQGAAVVAVVYDPPAHSGKDPALYKHDFSRPLPKLTPVGSAYKCRAALLEGGVYKVSDWIRS